MQTKNKEKFSVFGERLRVLLHKQMKTGRDLALLTGFTDAQVSRWLAGKVLPSVRTRKTIAQALGVPLAYFEEFNVVREETPLPGWFDYVLLYDIVGVSEGLLDFSKGDHTIAAFSERQLQSMGCEATALFGMKMDGDSMMPLIMPGDTLMICRSKILPAATKPMLAAVGTSLLIRSVTALKNRVRLEALNKSYDTIEVPAGDVTLLGTVVALMRSL